MCMDQGAFLLVAGDEEIPLGDVASLLVNKKEIRLIDVTGQSRAVSGQIAEIDLLNRRILLDT
ncbi:MAG: hypothetical protein C0621_02000 [Desulfuromonas sp.]|nr:MAG: hypothetical protein C0621_02000 [Desulfuromonas sp.]